MTDESMSREKARAKLLFEKFHEQFRTRFEALERSESLDHSNAGAVAAFFNARTRRNAGKEGEGGGGVMSSMQDGQVFEKAGINVSTVMGLLGERACASLAMDKEIPDLSADPRFWASGVSLVAHMKSPRVPAAHFNARMFWTPHRWWFGGSSDLNPAIEFDEDTRHFHEVMKRHCDAFNPHYYSRFKEWADTYFWIPHRNRSRGVGGIFFDNLNSGEWENDFAFVSGLGGAFLEALVPIVERRLRETWSREERQIQLVHRGHYAEFNLVYDRGTRFGLETGHDPNAVLMSLPPLARWPVGKPIE